MDLESIFQGKLNEHKWNLLGDYLKGQVINPGAGVLMERSPSSGVTISTRKPRERPPSQPPPFSVLSLSKVPESDPAEYKVTIQEGWVIERLTNSTSDSVEFHEVNIGASPMSTRPRPELTMSVGDFAMVYFTTDDEGNINSVPVIQAGAQTNSTHHQPPSGEGSGANGYYYVDLFELTLDAGAPVITLYQQSDIEHYRRWIGRNLGTGRWIHKEWNGANDTYDFRRLKQVEPSGRTYGKVIVPAVGTEFDAANDDIKFSAIAERLTSPQVNVNDDGAGIVTIEGNANDGSLTWKDCDDVPTTLITWVDGLVTSASSEFKAGCSLLPTGYTGEILYHNGTSWVTLANPGVPGVGNSFEYYELRHDGTAPGWEGVL